MKPIIHIFLQGIRRLVLQRVMLTNLVFLVLLAACNRSVKQEVFVMNNHSEALLIWQQHKLQGRTVVHVDAHDDFSPMSLAAINRVRPLLQAGKPLPKWEEKQDELVHIGNYLFVASKLGLVNQVYWVAGQLPIANESAAALYREQLGADHFRPDEVSTALSVNDGCMSGPLQGVQFSVCGSASMPHLSQRVLLDIDIDYFIKLLKLFPGKSLMEQVEIFRRDLLASGIKYDLVTIAKSLDGGFTPIEYCHLATAMQELVKDPTRELNGPFWATFRLRSDADTLLRSGDISAAREKITAILTKQPDDPHAHYLLASILAGENDWSGALNHASAAAQRDRDYVHGLVKFAQMAFPKDQQLAGQFISLAEKLDAANYALIELRANIAFNRGNFQEAAANYLKIYIGGSTKDDMYLGDTYLKMGNYSSAKRYYDHGLARFGQQPIQELVHWANSFLLFGEYLAKERHDYVMAKYYFDLFCSLPLSPEEHRQGVANIRKIMAH